MNFIALIILGFVPGLIWLFFFLRKDSEHPEPKSMIIRSFVMGMLIILPAVFIERYFEKLVPDLFSFNVFINIVVSFFVAVAFVEEFVKYLVIKLWIIDSKYFDEPIDAMIYPTIVALGFASMENIFVALGTPEQSVSLMAWRFISATLVHALCAGIWGYFIALVYFLKKPKYYIWIGLILGTFVHGLYNLIVSAENPQIFIIFFPLLILPISFLVAMGFKRLKPVT